MSGGSYFSESEEESLDITDSSSDYEITTKATKRRKPIVPDPPPPKRPRRKAASSVTSSSTSSRIPTPPDPSQQQQQQQQQLHSRRTVSTRPTTPENQGISAKELYDAVSSGKSAMVAVVDEWLDTYKQSREAGLLVLINFIVQSCGCKGVVTREMLDTMQNAEIISSLTKEFNEDSVMYPLSTPGPQLKRVKAGLCEFARVLVNSCRNSLIYDEYLFPSLMALLTGMTDSQVRAFRHTSTLLAMKLMSGMVDVAVMVSIQLQTIQRRYDLENGKSEHERTAARLEGLQATIRELRENKEEISSMMNATFRGVFVHRYRDLQPEIRAICIEDLGIWLKTDPEDFLNDRCLKYLGWTLHDKQSAVRLQSVRALQGLYREKEFIGRLELFTSRFKERMLNMVMDKDSDVAVETVNLLLLIHKMTEEGLAEEECGHIYPLVFTLDRGLATAAGCFLYNKLHYVASTFNQETGISESAAFCQILVSFFMQNEFHEHGAYLVDSLWGVAGSELRDWESMTSLLLQGSESGVEYEEEEGIIELMMCAMKRAAEAAPPVGRAPQGKKSLSMKDRKIQERDRRRITTHFIPLLPQLLNKYSADAGMVSRLLKAPLYFDLEMYNSTKQLEKHLDLLLSQTCGIITKHTDVAVLEACANLVSTLCSDRYTFSSRAHLQFSRLLDILAECFTSYLSELLQGTADDNDIYSAATALKRLAALSSAKNPTGLKLFDSCLELLNSGLESRELNNRLMVAALRFSAFHLMWAKVDAVTATPAEAEVKRVKKQVHSFCRVCQDCLSLTQTEIRDQAFELLCDLLVLYSKISDSSQAALRTLVHLPSDSLRFEMAAFLVDNIFSDTEDAELDVEDEEEEEKIIILKRKRNHLAGYCKLVLFGVLDFAAATDVFKHYSKYFKDFGDIIKLTLSKMKLINAIQSAKTVGLSLQQLFSELPTEERVRKNLSEISELAKRLSMSFGVNLQQVRRPLVVLHMDGMEFAFRDPQEGEGRHPNVAFLEILSEFSFKLLPPDRAQLNEILKSKCPSAALSWPPVRMYTRSLEGPTKHRRQVEAASSHDTPVAKSKKVAAQGETESAPSTVSRSWLDSSSIRSSLATPALTSTAQRQPPKRMAAWKPRDTQSDIATDLIEPESEDEFSSELPVRKIKPTILRRSLLSKNNTGLAQTDLDTPLTLMSLFEDREESESDDPGHESSYTLPSTRHTSISVLDELFD